MYINENFEDFINLNHNLNKDDVQDECYIYEDKI